MPRNPHYGIPAFPPTGNAEVDQALATWQQNMGDGYVRNLFEGERVPYSITTGSVDNATSGNYLTKNVQFQGTETVLVTGSLAVVVPNNSTWTAGLELIYPNGSIATFTAAPMLAGLVTSVASTLSLNILTTVLVQVEHTSDAAAHTEEETVASTWTGSVQTTAQVQAKMTVSQQWAPSISRQNSGLHTFSLALSSLVDSGSTSKRVTVTAGTMNILVL